MDVKLNTYTYNSAYNSIIHTWGYMCTYNQSGMTQERIPEESGQITGYLTHT